MEPSTRKISSSTYATDHGTKYITTHHESHDFVANESLKQLLIEHDIDAGTSANEIVDLVSDETKIFIKVEDAFYHFFVDSLPLILKIHREFPERLLVLYLQTARPSKTTDATIQLLLAILNGEGVNYRAVTIDPGKRYYPIYRVSNFSKADPYYSENHITTFVDICYARDLVVKYARQILELSPELVAPYKKVYLTRGPGAGIDVGTPPEGYNSGYTNDIRMEDSWKLEEFFASQGYEIVNPEEDFESLLHQIVFMADIKMLASVTSSGLMNMIFMQPKQRVLEIQTEIVQMTRKNHEDPVIPMQGVHTMYANLTFMQEHVLISIPSRRDPDEVIKVLGETGLSYLL